MSLGLLKPCLDCGELATSSRCDEHTTEHNRQANRRAWERRPSNREQGRDTAWRKLSEKARRLQPWCSDCGTDEDLTADHLPIAWHRRLVLRRPVRLRDVEVVCRGCNGKRGDSRPGSERYERWAEEVGLSG